MSKRLSLITCTFLLAYFVFVSGLVFEATKHESMSDLDLPPSIALSNYRISAVGVFTEDDRACMEWLVSEGNPSVVIRLDYNSMLLLNEYTSDRGVMYEEPTGAHYLFLSSDDIKNNRMTWGYEAGVRVYQPLPNTDNNEIVFKRGDAVVYYIAK